MFEILHLTTFVFFKLIAFSRRAKCSENKNHITKSTIMKRPTFLISRRAAAVARLRIETKEQTNELGTYVLRSFISRCLWEGTSSSYKNCWNEKELCQNLFRINIAVSIMLNVLSETNVDLFCHNLSKLMEILVVQEYSYVTFLIQVSTTTVV